VIQIYLRKHRIKKAGSTKCFRFVIAAVVSSRDHVSNPSPVLSNFRITLYTKRIGIVIAAVVSSRDHVSNPSLPTKLKSNNFVWLFVF